MNEKGKILIVDDMEVNRAILAEMFREQYEVLEACNGEEAINQIETERNNVCIVLLDLIMPVLDGFGVIDYMSKHGYMELMPIILITSEATNESDEAAYTYGVSDIIHKPFVPGIVMRRTKNIIDLYKNKRNMDYRLKEQAEKLMENERVMRENNEFLIDALSTVVEFRSLESGEHIKRIKTFTKILLRHLREKFPSYSVTEEEEDMIVRASAMHDIGKIGISDSILLKPGKLTKEEFDEMKKHTTIGCDILVNFAKMQDMTFFNYCYEICRFHHERWDGRGYPDGLEGEQIPVSAQIVAIADVYDALINKRVYKDSYSHDTAVAMILNGECGTFSPAAIQCFQSSRNEFALFKEGSGLI